MEMMLILNTTIAAETRAAWPRATVLRWIARASMACRQTAGNSWPKDSHSSSTGRCRTESCVLTLAPLPFLKLRCPSSDRCPPLGSVFGEGQAALAHLAFTRLLDEANSGSALGLRVKH
jgi:hypothetical protein